MKFSLAAIAGFASAVAGVGLPSAFTLVADGGKTVLTDGNNLWIGANSTTHEIAILRSGENGAVSFTSKNGVPTAFQSLYVIDKEVSPVGLTIPHSGATPKGASTTGFGQTPKGYFSWEGKTWFSIDGYGEAKEKEIFWYGAHNAEYASVNLWVKECKGC
ncbi:hypothetical protein N7532_000974 [Penicillium argentinense]|uniref:Uncharacterized protein n=1 Tax=Penicillium argentinense TaxID=1131581 RepID=A0A9W9G1K0_9EURO|nr:uncharacterized protein N7532_000974 [Penicillium argentinense]KAJ5110439.1 hypothetical protein N7532_000974 [Penicillium argentinense]